MFKFLKDKLKGAISRFSKKAEEEIEEKPAEEKTEEADIEETPVEKEIETIEEEVKEETRETIEEQEQAEEEIEEAKEVEESKPEEGEAEEEPKHEKEIKEKKGFFSKLKDSFSHKEKPGEAAEKPAVEKAKEKPEPTKEAEEEKPEPKMAEEAGEEVKEELKKEVKQEPRPQGMFAKLKEAVSTKKISEKKFDEMFWDMEVALLENNVAVEAIEKIKSDLKEDIVEKPIPRGKVARTIMNTLKISLKDLLSQEKISLMQRIKEKKPYVICFFGVNGSGKTTSIAKVAKMLKSQGLKVVLAAADTFRAAAIDQLQKHGDALDIKVIKHDYGSDAAAVAFDAVKHAESKGKDAVLIDTAGRLHSNSNLMDELKKVVKVANPDLKIFVGESITGNDCVEQAKQFNESIGIDCIILTKSDIDEKGGAAISISYITKKPILYLGTGQQYDDLSEFSADDILDNLGLAA